MCKRFSLVLLCFSLVFSFFADNQVFAGSIEQVNVSSEEVPATQGGWCWNVTSNGRYVAFSSGANNLVANDTNGADDIFVRDRELGITERVNLSSGGDQSVGNSFISPNAISSDGRFVVYQSASPNLVAGDTNGRADIFVFDRVTRVNERVSVSSNGEQGNSFSDDGSITPDGRFVVFSSVSTNFASGTYYTYQIYIRDRKLGITTLVSQSTSGESANGQCNYPRVSDDGRKVTFKSFANNLVPNDTSGVDIFVRDLETNTTVRANVASDGSQANKGVVFGQGDNFISGNGRYVSFSSDASNLVPGDTNGLVDVFIHDLETETTERVSLSTGGNGGSLSWDGRFVNFYSGGKVYIHDREMLLTEQLPVTGHSSVLSGFGNFVTYIDNAKMNIYIPTCFGL